MRREVEEKNRQMLRTEYLISFPAVIAGLFMCFVAAYVELPVWVRATLIAVAVVMILTVAFIAVGIEQKAGYYECQKSDSEHLGKDCLSHALFLSAGCYEFSNFNLIHIGHLLSWLKYSRYHRIITRTVS